MSLWGGRGSRRALVGESKVVGETGSSGDSPSQWILIFKFQIILARVNLLKKL